MKSGAQEARALSIRAPAKVNLHLRVLERRPDGYHSISTIFHTLGIWDELRISRASVFKFTSKGLPVPRGKDNLCVRAYQLMSSRCAFKSPVRIRLLKRIPAGAGLGGGSSDAAACLLGLDRLFGLNLGSKRLLWMAGQLGSDVPFFITGNAAWGRGRGERLVTLPSRLQAWAAVLKPRYSVSTRMAYDRLARRRGSRLSAGASANRIRRALAIGSLSGIDIDNDFTEIVTRLHPLNRLLLAGLSQAGLSPAFMSGSGSAVVGVGRSRKHAETAAAKLARRFRVSGYVARLAPYKVKITAIRRGKLD